MKKKNIIIAFDGPIRAGKTSLIKKLVEFFNVASLGEYKEYATNSGVDFPPYPPNSYEEAMDASIFFVGLEEKRVSDLKKLKLLKNKIIFVDRTYLSCVAFDYAANYFTKLGTFFEAQKLWKNKIKIKPDLTFFMDVSPLNIKKRILANDIYFPPHISNEKFNNYLTDFFKKECRRNELMVRIDANQTPEKVELDVRNYILNFFKLF